MTFNEWVALTLGSFVILTLVSMVEGHVTRHKGIERDRVELAHRRLGEEMRPSILVWCLIIAGLAYYFWSRS